MNMLIRKFLYYLLLLFSILTIYFFIPPSVHADSICDGTSPACVFQWIDYTYDSLVCDKDEYNRDINCRIVQQTTKISRCTIPQAGGGQCSCCWNDGCYLNCPGTNPPGGGGGGGSSCGDDSCDAGESCSNCPADCGSCSSPEYCGDNTCNNGESCTTCPSDCGICTGTVKMRAKIVASGSNVCSDLTSSNSYTPVNVTLFSEGSTKTTLNDGTYVTWAGSEVGTKFFTDSAPTDYVLALACYNTTSQPALTSGLTATLLTGETLTWDLGYTAGVGWFQAQGGDVYAATQLRSYIPASAVGGRYFSKDGNTGGTPGIVTFGTSADFDTTSADGYGYVSSKNWIVDETHDSTDYYAVMYHRFGSPTTADYPGGTTFTSKIASRIEPYYVDGDLIVDTADWSVGNGETITVLVNGSLTINKKINITGTGFVAFIVNGDITVSPNVGTTATSSTPVIEGIYITSPAGTFRTGSSTTAAARRFVGKGTFVAGTFALERDLDLDSHNIDYAADLFIYNPELMLRMPDKMKDLPVTWQEVAP